MNTKIIGTYDRLVNRFTKTGRIKNQIYKELSNAGMKEIRERAFAEDKFVMLASRQKGKGRSNMTIGVDLKKGYIQKETQQSKILTCFSKHKSSIEKYFTDWDGILLRKLTKNTSIVNGEIAETKNITEIPGKFVKTSETSIYSPIRRAVRVDYENGNKYRFSEHESGKRLYERIVDGVKYTFSNRG